MITSFQFCLAYVIVDVLCLVLTVVISGNISRDSGSERQVRYFYFLLTANLLFVVFDAIWAILVFGNVFTPNALMLSFVNGFNLSAIAFAAYFWFCFTLAYFESKVTDNVKLAVLTAIPALLVPVLHVIGHLTNQNVIFEADGSISYGIVHTIVGCVPLLYLLAATIVALHYRRQATTSAERRMALIFVCFMIAPVAAGIFDMIVPDMPVAAAGIIISIVMVMMSMQESRISADALTGLNNRRRSDTFLESSAAHASADHPLYLFIVDLNHFKSINDTYGHLEGDRALQLMADVLRSVCAQTNAFAGRWGGDEFIIINKENDLYEPERMAKLIQDTLSDKVYDAGLTYELTCTVGYATCTSATDDCARLIAQADEMLYRNKQLSR